jgi:hypothetical protein
MPPIAQKRDLVKVATFNINNINKRLDNLLAWLAKAEPDVVSLQDLKAEQEAFPVNALRTLGYEAVGAGWPGLLVHVVPLCSAWESMLLMSRVLIQASLRELLAIAIK